MPRREKEVPASMPITSKLESKTSSKSRGSSKGTAKSVDRPDNQKFDVQAGQGIDLGATVTNDGTNFAIFSAHAERVDLCLFDAAGSAEVARIELKENTNEVWHGFLPGIGDGQLYGYRVHGRYQPDAGFRFNANKLLIDPYARDIFGEVRWDACLYGYDVGAKGDADLTFSASDSAKFVPKCIVRRSIGQAQQSSTRLATPWHQSVIYELHARGFTMLMPGVADDIRGTFDALATKDAIAHIKSLGITAVELLPIHAFVDDEQLVKKKLRNYWGYNTIGFFAPQQRYLGKSGLSSMREMVRNFHDAGIEVILDVVYNHTAEGNERGATLSFKGIDNSAYYRLKPDTPRFYVNDTGTGNTINASHPRVIQMVLDSLRYWVQEMEVDGFRFDLATILGREADGFDPGCGFFDAIAQDPMLRRVKLIGEPWDIGPGGYQVGGFPPGWAEWNDKYRDTLRSYWRGDQGKMRDLAARITGSGDIYDTRGRRPWSSVNFLTAHDGFTLADLVAYNDKHNEANGEENRDGHGNNISNNYGHEGPTEDPEIVSTRERQKRNLMASLLLSHGTPMVLAGDEIGHTQKGNNNAYCQDGEISWIGWKAIGETGEKFLKFTKALTAVRRDHEIFRRASFRDGCVIRWLNPSGGDQTPEQWDDKGALTIGLLLTSPNCRGAQEALIIFNAFNGEVPFELPGRNGGQPWRRIIDTAHEALGDDTASTGSTLIAARSLVVLV